MMTSDPGILCFQHCDRDVRIFCFQLPDRCEVCDCDLSTAVLRMPPFRIPYPFVRASQHPYSIVIKPTKGDFLHDYQNSTDLHIGVTDAEGCVYEYDRHGLHTSRTKQWKQCLALSVWSGGEQGSVGSWREYWQYMLEIVAGQDGWVRESYNEESHNCYTFVLAFLWSLQHRSLSKVAASKMAFCEQFIVPRTTAAGKYISLYRKLREKGIYVHR